MLSSKGIDPTAAGILSAVPALSGMIGSIVIVRFISPRYRKLTIIALLSIVGIAMVVAAVTTGTVLLITIAVEGFCAAAFIPLMMNILMEMPQIGPAYMGAAAGLYFSIGEVGGFLGPSVIGTLASTTGSFVTGILLISIVMWIMIIPATRLQLPNQVSIKLRTSTQEEKLD